MTDDLDALLEDALNDGEEIHPSFRFRSAVMESVRDAAQPPIPFPWRRIALSAGLTAGAALLAVWNLPVSAESAPALPPAVGLLPLAALAALAARIVAAVAGD